MRNLFGSPLCPPSFDTQRKYGPPRPTPTRTVGVSAAARLLAHGLREAEASVEARRRASLSDAIIIGLHRMVDDEFRHYGDGLRRYGPADDDAAGPFEDVATSGGPSAARTSG